MKQDSFLQPDERLSCLRVSVAANQSRTLTHLKSHAKSYLFLILFILTTIIILALLLLLLFTLPLLPIVAPSAQRRRWTWWAVRCCSFATVAALLGEDLAAGLAPVAEFVLEGGVGAGLVVEGGHAAVVGDELRVGGEEEGHEAVGVVDGGCGGRHVGFWSAGFWEGDGLVWIRECGITR